MKERVASVSRNCAPECPKTVAVEAQAVLLFDKSAVPVFPDGLEAGLFHHGGDFSRAATIINFKLLNRSVVSRIAARIGLAAGTDFGYAEPYQMVSQPGSLAGRQHQPGVGKTQPKCRYHLDKIFIAGQMLKLRAGNLIGRSKPWKRK